MHTAVSESDLDHLDKWLRSKHGDLTASWSRIFPAHPARVALPDSERCPPKAEVVSSNLAGSANYFKGLTMLADLPMAAGEALGKQRTISGSSGRVWPPRGSTLNLLAAPPALVRAR